MLGWRHGPGHRIGEGRGGVLEPEAEIAAAITDTGRVGVLATPATVEGGAYLRALSRAHRELTVTEVAAPDLAAIIQRGFPFSEAVVAQVRAYCAPLHRANVDTVILGCTHYPLVRPLLQRILGRDRVTGRDVDLDHRDVREVTDVGDRHFGG